MYTYWLTYSHKGPAGPIGAAGQPGQQGPAVSLSYIVPQLLHTSHLCMIPLTVLLVK